MSSIEKSCTFKNLQEDGENPFVNGRVEKEQQQMQKEVLKAKLNRLGL